MRTRIISVTFFVTFFAGLIGGIFALTKPFGDDETQTFAEFVAYQKTLPEKKAGADEVSLIAVGDLMLSRVVADKIRQHGPEYPFLQVKDWLKTGDVVFGNLESPLTPGRHIEPYEMIFRADPSVAASVRAAGFSIVSLANNHTPNFGNQGLLDTFANLAEQQIVYVGAGHNTAAANEPKYLTVRGLTFAWLAYNDRDVVPVAYEATSNTPGTAFMRPDTMIAAVRAAKTKADFVVVSMHAGDEYATAPNQSQITFAHAAIDAGAELVLGHHPHVIQPIEHYRGKYIFYSLGNFVFDQMQSPETRRGLAVKIFFDAAGVSHFEKHPVLINDYSQPKFVAETETVTAAATGALADQNFILKNGGLKIMKAGVPIWESPTTWWVDDFVWADVTNDGVPDLSLSVWKEGDFGAAQPFWLKENDRRVRNHFFVFNFVEGEIKPIWQSSNLERPNCTIKIVDTDRDGRNELLATEGNYADWPACIPYDRAIWKWNGWGFHNESRTVIPVNFS